MLSFLRSDSIALAILLLCGVVPSQCFVSTSRTGLSFLGRSSSTTPLLSTTSDKDLLGSTTVSMDHYDVVKVDLADGRDYPIYIGTDYSADEGM